MSAHACTEDQLVEQPAIGLFAEQSAWPNPHPRPFSHWQKGGRQAGLRVRSLAVLVPRLGATLEKLNPTLPAEAVAAAIDELPRDRSAMGLPAANREIYRLLKDGIAVSVVDPEAQSSSPALVPRGKGVVDNAPFVSA